MKSLQPNITDDELSKKVESEFPDWFKNYARDSSNNVNVHIRTLAEGPSRRVNTYTGCKINGYRFHTLEEGTTKSTSNSGVCIKASNYGPNEIDYYGRLVEILELDFSWRESKKVLMFKCEWFDTTQLGTKIHPQYKLVDINHKRRYKKYEPFVIAEQATQVCYCPYPSLKRDNLDWWAVCKIKARSDVAFIESMPEKSFKEDNVDGRSPIDVSTEVEDENIDELEYAAEPDNNATIIAEEVEEDQNVYEDDDDDEDEDEADNDDDDDDDDDSDYDA